MLWPQLAGTSHFAATPSGWITGVGLPLTVLFIGWRLARTDRAADQRSLALENRLTHIENTQDVHTQALSAHSASLQVMVAEVAPLKSQVSEQGASITTLRERTAELRATVESFVRERRERGPLPAGPDDVRDC